MQYAFNYFGRRSVCPLKIEITQFPGGFRLKRFSQYRIIITASRHYGNGEKTLLYSCKL